MLQPPSHPKASHPKTPLIRIPEHPPKPKEKKTEILEEHLPSRQATPILLLLHHHLLRGPLLILHGRALVVALRGPIALVVALRRTVRLLRVLGTALVVVALARHCCCLLDEFEWVEGTLVNFTWRGREVGSSDGAWRWICFWGGEAGSVSDGLRRGLRGRGV